MRPRPVDNQGRTIIPREVRDAIGLADGGHVVWEVEGKRVVLRVVRWRPE
jgi:AbrB family looped-hinge helix DNA binding protein